MATSWVLGKISDALQPTIHSTVSSAGNFAGGALSSVGSGINGVGQSINGTIKRYGDGIVDYGNGVMDWSNATGPRASTAQNPLGLSGSKTAGKTAVTSPSVYRAPDKSPSKTLTTTAKSQAQKKPSGAPVKKAGPAIPSAPKPGTGSQPLGAKKAVTGAAKAPSATAKTPVNNGVVKSGTAKKPVSAVKPSTASATKAKLPPTYKPNYTAAANPLGLTG